MHQKRQNIEKQDSPKKTQMRTKLKKGSQSHLPRSKVSRTLVKISGGIFFAFSFFIRRLFGKSYLRKQKTYGFKLGRKDGFSSHMVYFCEANIGRGSGEPSLVQSKLEFPIDVGNENVQIQGGRMVSCKKISQELRKRKSEFLREDEQNYPTKNRLRQSKLKRL